MPDQFLCASGQFQFLKRPSKQDFREVAQDFFARTTSLSRRIERALRVRSIIPAYKIAELTLFATFSILVCYSKQRFSGPGWYVACNECFRSFLGFTRYHPRIGLSDTKS